MITLRPYTPSDYAQVKSLLLEAGLFAETWESEANLAGMIERDPTAITLAVDGNEVVGNLFMVAYGPKIFHLYRLAVRKSHQQQGIASLLLKHAEELARQKGAVEIDLFVDAKSEKLLNFYKKRDFVASQNVYVPMWKELE